MKWIQEPASKYPNTSVANPPSKTFSDPRLSGQDLFLISSEKLEQKLKFVEPELLSRTTRAIC
jgi:hypothetical protein